MRFFTFISRCYRGRFYPGTADWRKGKNRLLSILCPNTNLCPKQILQCQECSLGFREKVPVVGELEEAYSEDPMPEDYIRTWEESWTPIFSKLLEKIEQLKPERGNLLDIGSQLGLFSFLASQSGWKAYGLDPNKQTIERGKERGVNMFEGIFSKVELPKNNFDVITAWLVYENLPCFFEETVKVKDLLKGEGLFAIKISNFAFYKNLRFVTKTELGRITFSKKRRPCFFFLRTKFCFLKNSIAFLFPDFAT